MLLAGEDYAHPLNLPLCHSLAITAQRLCKKFVDPSAIAPFLACRLIALNENPGVRPVGIGDTARQIIAKAILTVTRLDIQEAAGSLQLCASQISGIEAAVHAVNSLFQQEETGPFCWWMPAMRLTASIVSLLFITSVDCVHHLLQPSSTPTGCQLNCLSMVMCYIPVRVPPKGTLLLRPCTLWLQFPLSRSYTVTLVM